MVRKISFTDLNKAVTDAYNEYKNLDKGEIDARVKDADANDLAISVVLTDGRTIECGNTDKTAVLGNIAAIPVHAMLLQQYDLKQLIKKAGKTTNHRLRKMDLPVKAHAVRAVSAVQPQNDADGKYDLLVNNMINMVGSEPVFDDKMYTTLTNEILNDNVENKLAEVDYELYDDARASLNVLAKMESLRLNTTQLATMGATVAADGVNPVTDQTVFDGTLSAPLTTIAAIHGNPDRNRRWLLKSGVPAVFSFSGMVLAIMPGVGAIAAYGAQVGKHGRSKKGGRAIRFITNAIGYNVFNSDRIEVTNRVLETANATN